MICAGIDAGSRAIKVVVADTDGAPDRRGSQPGDLARAEVIGSAVADQGIEQDRLATGLFEQVLAGAGLSREDVGRVVATGYARGSVSAADTTITEITCHACGVRCLRPDARTVIEIGGQDSKVLRLAEHGAVRDFAMNDRCAAGTGRFLEVVADRLDIGLEELGNLATRSSAPAAISSMCVVFAETELLGLLAAGARIEDIVAGIQAAVAARVCSMVGRNVELPVILTGGVAMIPGMALAFEVALGHPVSVAPDPQFTGALGAAILAGREGSR